MISCNPSVDDFDFAEVDDFDFAEAVKALTHAPLTGEGARLVTKYATFAPGMVDHDCPFAYAAQAAALHLCQPYTAKNALAMQLDMTPGHLSNITVGRGGRKPDEEKIERVQRLLFHQGMSLRNCTLTLFAHACAPWTLWQDAPMDWLTDISNAKGTLMLIRAIRDDHALSVWRGMMDPESQYRANHLGTSHLLRVIEEARLGIRNEKALPGIGVDCPC